MKKSFYKWIEYVHCGHPTEGQDRHADYLTAITDGEKMNETKCTKFQTPRTLDCQTLREVVEGCLILLSHLIWYIRNKFCHKSLYSAEKIIRINSRNF